MSYFPRRSVETVRYGGAGPRAQPGVCEALEEAALRWMGDVTLGRKRDRNKDKEEAHK